MRRRGQARYAEYPLECTKANSYNPKQDMVRIRLGFYKGLSACRATPQSGPLGLPAQLCIKQLYAIL